MITRMSELFVRTLRDDPADAEVPSHRWLVRAGYIRRAAPGIYCWLPLGYKVLRNVERIVREEMDAIGAQEVHLPALLPREPYEATGRWTDYGTEHLPAEGPQGRRLPAGPHPRGDVHAAGEGPVLLLQGPAAVALPDPDQVPGRGAAPGRAAARPGVRDEGLLLLRHRRRAGFQASYQRTARRTSTDLRPARLQLRHRLRHVGCDGRLGQRGVPGRRRERRGHLRPLPGGYAANVEAVRIAGPRAAAVRRPAGRPRRGHPDTPTIETLVAVANERVPRADRPGRRGHPEERGRDGPASRTAPASRWLIGLPGDRERRPQAARRRTWSRPRSGPFTEADFADHPGLVKGYIGPSVLGAESATSVRYLVDPRVVHRHPRG